MPTPLHKNQLLDLTVEGYGMDAKASAAPTGLRCLCPAR